MTDSEQLAKIRFMIVSTGLIENEEYSTTELAGKLAEKAKGISDHMTACRALLQVPNDEVLYEEIAHVLDTLREAVKRLKAHNDPADMFWIQGVAAPFLK